MLTVLWDRLARYFHFGLLALLLRFWPSLLTWPAWPLAAVRFLLYPDTRRLAGPALRALGQPHSTSGRQRFCWKLCYQNELDLMLRIQVRKLSQPWADERVDHVGSLPPGGAVLIMPHHANARLAFFVLRKSAQLLGLVGKVPYVEQVDWQPEDSAARIVHLESQNLFRETFGPRIFPPRQALEAGLALLQEGGYLLITPDAPDPKESWPRSPVLGKALQLGPGPVTLARASARPIVPVMVVPHSGRWRVWLGEPIAPDDGAVGRALEACIRQAPASWLPAWWRQWLLAPVWPGDGTNLG